MTANTAPTGNLEITVSRAELLRELTAAQSVVERKTTIPILSNFLFEATDDGKLTITAKVNAKVEVIKAQLDAGKQSNPGAHEE